MTTIENEVFSAFLAGCLYDNDTISCLDLSQAITNFEIINDIEVEEPDCDYLKLYDIVVLYKNQIKLIKGYDEIYNGMTIREYLHSLTTSRVRSYFNIPDGKKLNNVISRKRTLKYLINTCFIKGNM